MIRWVEGERGDLPLSGCGIDPGMEVARERAIRASMSVFKEHGYQGATMEEIARRAETSLDALRALFPDKEELYHQACRSAVETWHRWFVEKARAETDPLASFVTLCREAFLFLARDRETREFLLTGPLVFVFSSERFDDITERGVSFLASKLRECAEAGVFDPMDYGQVAVTMHEIFKLLILTTYTRPYDERAEELFENVLNLFLHGLLARPAP